MNLVQFAKKYIDDNISSDVSLIKLSEVTGYNPSYISRIFKEVTEQTLSDYISLVRIHKVQERMKQKKLSLTDIALSVGLQSRQYFNRFIKKMTNLTPQEYYKYLNHELTDVQITAENIKKTTGFYINVQSEICLLFSLHMVASFVKTHKTNGKIQK